MIVAADLPVSSMRTSRDAAGGAEVLTLRAPTLDDEAQVRSAQAELAGDRFTFVFDLEARPWPELLAGVERQRYGEGGRSGCVPTTFLLAVVGPDVVGRVTIRHQLNEFWLQWGGHIGGAVRPAFRRRGYASTILKLSLGVAHELALDHVLLTCDDTNIASAAVIERCGGRLENIIPGETADHPPKRRYWLQHHESAQPDTPPQTADFVRALGGRGLRRS